MFLRDEVAQAAREVPLLGRHYAAKSPPVTPISYARLVMHSSGHQYLTVDLRFTVKVRARRGTHSALTLHLLAGLRERGIPVYQNFPYHSPAPEADAQRGPQAGSGEAGPPIGEPPRLP
jgi:hypothetical protein